MVKMQVFELLAALALFDPQGCHLTLDAFDSYKVPPSSSPSSSFLLCLLSGPALVLFIYHAELVPSCSVEFQCSDSVCSVEPSDVTAGKSRRVLTALSPQ